MLVMFRLANQCRGYLLPEPGPDLGHDLGQEQGLGLDPGPSLDRDPDPDLDRGQGLELVGKNRHL